MAPNNTHRALTRDQTGSQVRDIREGQRRVVDPFHGTHGTSEATDVLLHTWGTTGSWEAKMKRSSAPWGENGSMSY